MKYEYRHANFNDIEVINKLGLEGYRIVAVSPADRYRVGFVVMLEKEIREMRLPGEFGFTKEALCAMELAAFHHGLACGNDDRESDIELARLERVRTSKVLHDAFPDDD